MKLVKHMKKVGYDILKHLLSQTKN